MALLLDLDPRPYSLQADAERARRDSRLPLGKRDPNFRPMVFYITSMTGKDALLWNRLISAEIEQMTSAGPNEIAAHRVKRDYDAMMAHISMIDDVPRRAADGGVEYYRAETREQIYSVLTRLEEMSHKELWIAIKIRAVLEQGEIPRSPSQSIEGSTLRDSVTAGAITTATTAQGSDSTAKEDA